MNAQEQNIVAMMEKFGGSFVKALAAAYRVADDSNRYKLRQAFKEYWAEYSKIARSLNK